MRSDFGVRLGLGLVACALASAPARAADVAVREGDHVVRDYRFASGEFLPEVRLHYRTLGTPVRDGAGVVRNAVLVLHGTGGTGAQFLQPQFAGEMFGPGQPLDLASHYVILPDGIGHGGSSKPSDGLRQRFPKYGYTDMVALQHRLLTEGLGVRTCSSCWVRRWAACTGGCGVTRIPPSWTRSCRSRACPRPSSAAIASGAGRSWTGSATIPPSPAASTGSRPSRPPQRGAAPDPDGRGPDPVAEGRAHARGRGRVPRGAGRAPAAGRRRQRHALPVRRLA